ncbi:hypothetical protein [Mycobacterium sp.]|uniref:hypothetical protein n=1 Tax=Mycobacterium sp. TaxID=1785 RepID=UPI003BB15130
MTAEPPGRGTPPVDMASLNIGQRVDGIAEQIETRGLKKVDPVGHSMASVTFPGVT